MSRTDKYTPFSVRQIHGEVGHSGNWGAGDSGFRKGRKALKRRGNRTARRIDNKCLYRRWWDLNTVRFAISSQ